MKKQMFLSGLKGIPNGISVGYVITIIISLLVRDGDYSPVVYTLMNQFENEISAVIFQTALFAVMGFVNSVAILVWDMEDWGLLKQTGTHFFVVFITMFPVAYFSHWIERSFRGFVIFFCIATIMFAVVWVIQYCTWKYKIKKINEKLGGKL
ncbi:MAG: DUF3021 domain-containing protein [Defluviitaleaceae bacterium]|nr:DUF3021 domain-containing protein [Defluviitaleaceae bacterium]